METETKPPGTRKPCAVVKTELIVQVQSAAAGTSTGLGWRDVDIPPAQSDEWDAAKLEAAVEDLVRLGTLSAAGVYRVVKARPAFTLKVAEAKANIVTRE